MEEVLASLERSRRGIVTSIKRHQPSIYLNRKLLQDLLDFAQVPGSGPEDDREGEGLWVR